MASGRRVIGGLHMIDAGEADDKIMSVLENDYVWGTARDILIAGRNRGIFSAPIRKTEQADIS